MKKLESHTFFLTPAESLQKVKNFCAVLEIISKPIKKQAKEAESEAEIKCIEILKQNLIRDGKEFDDWRNSLDPKFETMLQQNFCELYPSQKKQGIKRKPKDSENIITLMKQIRNLVSYFYFT